MKNDFFTEPGNLAKGQAELVLDAGATLGEGALWLADEEKLLWVDIEGRMLHGYDPLTGENRSWPTGSRIGTVVPVKGGGVLVALQNGIHHMDLHSGALTFVVNPLPDPNLRFNDGKCDPSGRFWVGSMDLDLKEKAAALYRLDTDLRMHRMVSGVTISNGIVWTANKRTMYYNDTHTMTVQAFDYDDATGTIRNQRIAISIPENEGSPDGMAIDAEDKLWVALWGGHAVARFDPESGVLLQKINVPAPHVSSCAFGGKELDTLFITTARSGLTTTQLNTYPKSGGLFAIKPGVTGMPTHYFNGRI
jgi:sugar lactone lactonase YvrE